MEKKQFKTNINAARNIVWHVLWSDATYRQWTNAFTEGSHAVSDWNEGSEIQFLDGKGSGMYSVIDKKKEPEYMAFRHVGEIKDGKKEAPGAWSGSMETYTLNETDGKTDLIVEMDITEEFASYFEDTFPKALQKVKELAESDAMRSITVETDIKAPVEKVWKFWTEPVHITKWCSASDDWHTPRAENDLKVGGTFSSRMEAKDGSFGFDFGGIYSEVKPNKEIAYTIGDGRKVKITFVNNGNQTKVIETFETENTNSVEMQRFGWQAILNNFKKYTEAG